MNHQEIEQSEIVERYLQQRLTNDERLAFQEHYFACDECFQQVRTMAQFIAGVQNASRNGLLDSVQGAAGPSSWFGWFQPAFVLSLAAAILIAAIAWLTFWKVPSYQSEIARERKVREESQQQLIEARRQTEEIARQLEAERERSREQSQQNSEQGPTRSDLIAQASVPTVTLEAVRSSDSPSLLTLPTNAKYAVLRIPVEPGNRVSSYRVVLQTREGQAIETFNQLRPNRAATLSITLPTKNLSSRHYIVRIYGAIGTQTELLGEYDLRVVVKQ